MSVPDLSVVIVSAAGFDRIRRTVQHLRQQSARERTQIVIVAESVVAVADREPHETAGFHDVLVVPVGPIDNVDKAAAHGIRRATAPVVAIIEDHAYPEPGWAEGLIDAHRDEYAAVGTAVVNANPSSLCSWANMLVAYGQWSPSAAPGVAADIARHNSSFKREVLAAYGDELERLLGRDGGLLQDLTARGHRFYFLPAARIAHANPSRLLPTADLRFNAGRLYAARRAERGRWSFAKRALYAAAGPLIPLIRFKRVRQDVLDAGRGPEVGARLVPALALALLLDGLGQIAGYLAGPGGSLDTLAVFEMDRLTHLNATDRKRLGAPLPESR